jgi:16S rRNA (guanine1207-N2)-methyltransferase
MPHYYSDNNVDLHPQKIKIRIKSKEYPFWSGSGVFSRERLDKGTEALILAAEVKEGEKILDLGCGYGVVGIILALEKKVIPEFIDINPNAIKLTRMNLKEYSLKGKTRKSDLYEKAETYDAIICNPPYVAGRETCSMIITESLNHLEKGGNLQIVARYQKGGKYFEKLMEDTFGNVETLIKKSGYRVFKSVK